ncbi:MAG: LacI family DNA-binding transcriptional regulator [Streptosporangiales bacterium]|nr:LacI family DNA-binding transcriptional regulator [Streptosporangiales bacterium]
MTPRQTPVRDTRPVAEETGTASNRTVTIRDVAEAAGVSATTVSHALSGRRVVAPATRAKVAAAVDRLGYRANEAARSLRTGRLGILGLVFRPRDAVHGSLMGTEYHQRLAGAAATAALDRGLGLLHIPDPLGPEARRLPMDGCILVSPSGSDRLLGELIGRGLPLVSADPDPDHPELGWWVGRDDTGAIAEVLDHLDAAGARDVVLLVGTDDNAWNRGSRLGFEAWLRDRPHVGTVVPLFEGTGAPGADEAVDELLRAGQRPDAIIGSSGRFAAGAAAAARRHGLATPGDVMLVALSDSEVARGHDPQITALELHPERIARAAVALLVDRLDGHDQPPPRVFTPTLKVRASTTR